MESHLRGKQHKKKTTAAKIDNTAAKTDNTFAKTDSSIAAKADISAAKSDNTSAKINNTSAKTVTTAVHDSRAVAKFRCDLCHVTAPSQDQLDSHNKGKTHQ